MSPETWTSLAVSAIAGGCSIWAARAARRTPRQERRDDFIAITEQQGRAIERLENRVATQEAEAEKQRQRVVDQDEAIGWLLTRVRGLVSYIRSTGLEPPAAADPSDRARVYLGHIDV